MTLNRVFVDMPPQGITIAPIRVAASKPVQKPRKGPKEKGKAMRSDFVIPIIERKNRPHVSSIHPQPRSVSSQRSGCPVVVPEVWCSLTYSEIGRQWFVPYGGVAC